LRGRGRCWERRILIDQRVSRGAAWGELRGGACASGDFYAGGFIFTLPRSSRKSNFGALRLACAEALAASAGTLRPAPGPPLPELP
jgi:hypothetical protein